MLASSRTPFLRVALGAAACTLLGLVHLSSPAPAAMGGDDLSDAYQAILDFEAAVNARDAYGNYLSQGETATQFADRIGDLLSPAFVGVSGMGPLEDYLGSVPTFFGPVQDAQAIIDNRTLLLLFDPNGTADWIHTAYDGQVSGNSGSFVLNFAVLGSQTDGNGNRLPIDLPNSIFDPNDNRVTPVCGRCICTCERVGGQWQITAFYFVLTPPSGLF